LWPLLVFASVPPKVLQSFRQRAADEAPYELRRHPEPLLITLLAAYCHVRGQDLTDTLVDLLLEIVHHIASKAETRVEQQLIEELKRVAGKNGLLCRLAEAALEHPDGIIKGFGRIGTKSNAKPYPSIYQMLAVMFSPDIPGFSLRYASSPDRRLLRINQNCFGRRTTTTG